MNLLTICVYLYLFILLILVLMGINSKMYCALGCALSWIVMAGNSYNPDYYTYYYGYTNATSRVFDDIGWNFLMNICRSLSLDYQHFVYVIAFCGLALLFISANRITSNLSVFTLFYMFSFLVIDTIQIRNFFAFAIVIFGFSYLIKNTRASRAIYVIAILIASSVHITSLVFLAVLFMNKKRYSLNIIIVMLVMFLAVVISVSPSIKSYMNFVYLLFGKDYSASQTVGHGYLYILTLVLITFAVLNIQRKKIDMIDSPQLNQIYDLCYNLNILCFCIIPLCSLNMNAYRIIRYIQVFNLILFSISYSNLRSGSKVLVKKNAMVCTIGWTFNFLCYYYFIYFVYGSYDKLVATVLENNCFFE